MTLVYARTSAGHMLHLVQRSAGYWSHYALCGKSGAWHVALATDRQPFCRACLERQDKLLRAAEIRLTQNFEVRSE